MAFKYKVQSGDTLNSISASHGFSNYKDAGISSVPSGNFDLVRPGDEIDLANYDPSKVKPIGVTSPVISSKDVAGEFNTNSAKVDSLTKPPATGVDTKPTDTTKPVVDPLKTSDPSKKDATTGDAITDFYMKWETEQKAKIQKAEEDKTLVENQLKSTSLALNDSTYQATISNISASYNKRLVEQTRINNLNIDRVKAYGLGGSGATIDPIGYTDAVSLRETEAADAITALDNERNNLLAQAKLARDTGEANILRTTLDRLNSVEEESRKKLQDLYTEVDRNTKLWRQARTDAETKHKEQVQNMLATATSKYAKKFGETKTPEEKDKLVKSIMEEYGIMATDSDTYYKIFSALGTGASTIKKTAQDEAKATADLESTKALTAKRKADAAKSWRSANGVDTTEETEMAKMVPSEFASKEEAGSAKTKLVTKYGDKGRKYWDSIFLDENDTYKYPIKGTGTGASKVDPTAIKKRATSAGYNYDSMKAQGYTDEEIDTALKGVGK